MSAAGGKKNHGGTITINNKAFENGPPDSDNEQGSGGKGKMGKIIENGIEKGVHKWKQH